MVALDAQATAVMGLLEALEDSNTDIYRQTDTSLLMMMKRSFITHRLGDVKTSTQTLHDQREKEKKEYNTVNMCDTDGLPDVHQLDAAQILLLFN